MPPTQNRAVVVGAGIVGLTAACRLAESGYNVTVIEQVEGPGRGASKANAGQLLFDRIGALGSPGFLRGLIRTVFDRSQGVAASGLIRPDRWAWTSQFLRQCTTRAWQRNTREMLELAHLSAACMSDFSERHDLAFEWRRPGKLITYASLRGLDAAQKAAEYQALFGGVHERLGRQECLDMEPALRGTARAIGGAIYLRDAEVGDCHACCRQLANILSRKLAGQIRYGCAVTGLDRKDGRVIGLRVGDERIDGDIFVLATGMATNTVLRPRFQGKKPIVGIKGISLTYPLGADPPDLSVTDASGKFVVMRLGARLRVAGFAIFSDNLTVTPAQVQLLAEKARALMPGAADWQVEPEIWAGLRPQTPDDLPMIGRAGASNLYVNAGHGSLGWTMAFGSAEKLLASIAAV